MNDQIKSQPVPQPAPQPAPKVEPKFHCSNCRETYEASGVRMVALDYVQDPETGKPVAANNRVSVFCKKCDHFIRVIDPQRDATLDSFRKKPGTGK